MIYFQKSAFSQKFSEANYGWYALTHLTEKAQKIQQTSLKIIFVFLATLFDATIGLGILCSLSYNSGVFLRNRYAGLKHLYQKYPGNEGKKETRRAFISGMFTCLGMLLAIRSLAFRFFPPKTSFEDKDKEWICTLLPRASFQLPYSEKSVFFPKMMAIFSFAAIGIAFYTAYKALSNRRPPLEDSNPLLDPISGNSIPSQWLIYLGKNHFDARQLFLSFVYSPGCLNPLTNLPVTDHELEPLCNKFGLEVEQFRKIWVWVDAKLPTFIHSESLRLYPNLSPEDARGRYLLEHDAELRDQARTSRAKLSLDLIGSRNPTLGIEMARILGNVFI